MATATDAHHRAGSDPILGCSWRWCAVRIATAPTSASLDLRLPWGEFEACCPWGNRTGPPGPARRENCGALGRHSFRFARACEGIAAKFAHGAAHGIMPTQGCSQARSQRLVGGAGLATTALSPRRLPSESKPAPSSAAAPARGVNNASALAESGGPESIAPAPGSKGRRVIGVPAVTGTWFTFWGVNQQPILNHAAGNGGHNTLSRRAHACPAAPSQSIPAPNTN